MTKKQFISRRLALTAVALATLSLSALPASAENAPKPAPAGEVAHEGPRDGHKDGPKEGRFEKRGKEMFEKTDGDKDGFLSKAEMEASQKERLDAMFNKSDLDQDGKLSPEELKKGREAMREKFRAKDKDREHHGGRDEPKDGPPSEKPPEDKPAQ